MQISLDQVAQETRVDPTSTTGLVQFLKTNHGVKNPKVILVFDSNKGGADEAKNPWKIHVFYSSPSSLEQANLQVPTVLRDTKIMAQGEEIIRTIYPDGWIGWCGKINGQPIWIT